LKRFNNKKLVVQTAPVGSVVMLDDFRSWIRQDEGVEDNILLMQLRAATDVVERYLGRTLLNTVYEYWMDYFPFTRDSTIDYMMQGPVISDGYGLYSRQNWIDIPRPPLVSVASVTVYDPANNATVVDSSNYYVDTANNRLVFVDTFTPQTALRNVSAIKIVLTAGYGTNPELVPYGIRLGIMQQAASTNECRANDGDVAPSAQKILRPYRVMGVTLNGV